ncbi:GlxA family transcriptional regulator [Comamonas sp. 26]|uniref:GlxA family transcriptional regulator n=1 Tax=Comamonas sp. 26 TaxID=2035201 RepID=UPI000C190B8F|nr:helix-turn-helix domain-containing protein [Comamonas sp. 26]PIG08173.1 AraC family transcriptional regulator with amidase-like domain [Comamonas sp. 26]
MEHRHSHPHTLPHRIDLIVYPGFKSLEAIGPMSVFDYANIHLRGRGQRDGYEVRITSAAQGVVQSDTLMALQATQSLGELAERGTGCTVIVVGSRHIETVLGTSGELVQWLQVMAVRVPRLIALCSGSFFLAEAGLLDERRAATHWSVAKLLAQRYPRVQVDADAIYVRDDVKDSDGERQIWTSAGVTAGIDLALAVVEQDFGHALALEVARDLVMYLKRPGGQSQFSVPLAAQSTQHRGVQAVQQWVLAHLEKPVTLAQMAEQAAMSERHFRRVFQQETGQSPSAFVENARLEAAKQLLEAQSQRPLKTVAAHVGLGSEQALRHLFVKKLGITPVAYRERFGD